MELDDNGKGDGRESNDEGDANRSLFLRELQTLLGFPNPPGYSAGSDQASSKRTTPVPSDLEASKRTTPTPSDQQASNPATPIRQSEPRSPKSSPEDAPAKKKSRVVVRDSPDPLARFGLELVPPQKPGSRAMSAAPGHSQTVSAAPSGSRWVSAPPLDSQTPSAVTPACKHIFIG